MSPEVARKTAAPRKAIKETKWNGGMTHKRAILGIRMMDLLGKLEREASQAARAGKLLRQRGDG